ncbi:MAG TPA: PQQ-dependent sugar dehydrogenase [Vicinamibacterales bacterium]|nr:PQQ-dependent sugar dehydrogenase [Vicinamibacterales bacterium]
MLFVLLALGRSKPAAQAPLPTLVDPNLIVRPVISGLEQPTSMAFIGPNEFLVLEKATGRVKHVVNGAVAQIVLDLSVNSASERGLLGIAVHPQFSSNRFIYLFWSCTAAPGPNTFQVSETACSRTPATGQDSSDVLAVPLLGNRIDRFVWTGAALQFNRNIAMLRSFQHDRTNPVPRGNHDGGVLRFGGDGKLYAIFGDAGRRGQLQNLIDGVDPAAPDDQFGGPGPDTAHFTGVILRLNDDGGAPEDNPFFALGAGIGGEVGANLQKTFAYGVRNSFGMAFDPVAGHLWDQQNGDDTFDELNRVTPGANLGWAQIMGPLARVAEFKALELSFGSRDLQQLRWSPAMLPDTAEQAVSRMFMLPGAIYEDPAFSWKWAIAPAAIGFLRGDALGAQYANDLFIGASRTTLLDGYLFRIDLTPNRLDIAFADSRLTDRVADNAAKFDITESESMRFGSGFGVGTDIQTGPNGLLYVVSLSNGAVYEIARR